MASLEELKTKFRIIRYYTWSKRKGVIQNDVICQEENVDMIYKKHRRAREMGNTNPHYCDDCRLTACWDKGKVIRCKEKKVKQA